MEEQPNKPSFFLIVFVLFLIVSIIIVTIIYVKKGLNSDGISSLFNKKDSVIVEPIENISYFTMELKTNAKNVVDYNLYEEGTFLLNGKIEPNIKLLYSKSIYNKTYLFEAKKDKEYYYNKKTCWVLGNTTCYLELKEIGNYSLSFANNILYLNQQKEGVLQSPLLCIAWTFDIYLVKIESFEKTQIPKRLRHLVDVCYILNDDIVSNKQYKVDVTRVNPKVSKITFYVIDKDVGSDSIVSYEQDTGFSDIILQQEI